MQINIIVCHCSYCIMLSICLPMSRSATYSVHFHNMVYNKRGWLHRRAQLMQNSALEGEESSVLLWNRLCTSDLKTGKCQHYYHNSKGCYRKEHKYHVMLYFDVRGTERNCLYFLLESLLKIFMDRTEKFIS